MTFTEDGQKLRFTAKGVYILNAQGNIISADFPLAIAPNRPSQLSGRVFESVTLNGLTDNALVHTVTPGKIFYVTDIILSVDNSANSPGSFNLRDGLTVAGGIVLPLLVNEGPAGGTALTETSHSFLEPLEFNSGVFYEEVSGTLTASGILQGYEE